MHQTLEISISSPHPESVPPAFKATVHWHWPIICPSHTFIICRLSIKGRNASIPTSLRIHQAWKKHEKTAVRPSHKLQFAGPPIAPTWQTVHNLSGKMTSVAAYTVYTAIVILSTKFVTSVPIPFLGHGRKVGPLEGQGSQGLPQRLTRATGWSHVATGFGQVAGVASRAAVLSSPQCLGLKNDVLSAPKTLESHDLWYFLGTSPSWSVPKEVAHRPFAICKQETQASHPQNPPGGMTLLLHLNRAKTSKANPKKLCHSFLPFVLCST